MALIRLLIVKAKCRVSDLRTANGVLLLILGAFALVCRSTIERIRSSSAKSHSNSVHTEHHVSAYAIHTAVNIILFPPLFFFSGLFYTDIASTGAVLITYAYFLNTRSSSSSSILGGIFMFLWGLVTLVMRQTNIFWAAVFIGGLDVVRSLKALPSSGSQPDTTQWKIFNSLAQQANNGVFDPSLRQSTVFGNAIYT